MNLVNYSADETNGTDINPAITEAWKAKRLGRFTSSTIARLLVKGKSDVFGEAAKTLIYKKAGEELTQEANEATGAAIKWGEEHEEDAVKMFERLFGKEVEYYGKKNPVFIEHGQHAGGSPDGFIKAEKAVVETKCPYESGYHAEVFHKVKTGTFDLKKYDADYYGQVQFNIFLTKADFGYFVSYDPRCIDYRYTVAVARIEKDEAYIADVLERIELATKVKLEYLEQIGFIMKQAA